MAEFMSESADAVYSFVSVRQLIGAGIAVEANVVEHVSFVGGRYDVERMRPYCG